MRTFILRSSLFFFLLVLIFVAIQLQPRRFPPNDFLYGVALKHHLTDGIQKPKIILVGGSGVAFGFDSRKIQDSLGMPVVNMGMHIQLGLDFMLNELKAVMKANDIVFLSPEFMISMKGTWEAKSAAGRFYPPSKAYYPWDPIANLGFILEINRRKFKEALAKVVFSGNNSVYCRDAFDTTNGDVIAHLDSAHCSVLAGSTLKYAYWPGIRAINHFAEYARTRNVKVYFLFPDYAESFFQRNWHVIRQYQSDVNKDLKIPVINSPTDFVYPDSVFYDTEYHLLRAGRKMRTDRFIQLVETNPAVRPYLPAPVVTGK